MKNTSSQKILAASAAALVLGGSFATVPDMLLAEDSGLVNTAMAADNAPLQNVTVNWVMPDKLSGLGNETGTFQVSGDIADSVKPGQNINFEVPDGVRLGAIKELKTPSGETLATLTGQTGRIATYTTTDFVNGKTNLKFKYDGTYSFNNGGKNTGDTAPIKVNINGAEYDSGSVYTFEIPNVTAFSPSLYAGQTALDAAYNAAYASGPGDIPDAAKGGYTLTSNLNPEDDITFPQDRLPRLKWGDTYSHSFYINDMGLVKWVPNGENSWVLEATGEPTFERDGVVMDLPVGSTYTISGDGKQSVLHLVDPNDSTTESLTLALYTKLGAKAMAEGFATGEKQEYKITGVAEWGDKTLTSEQSRPATSRVIHTFTKGGGDGTFFQPTANITAYVFDTTGAGSTADGQDSDANTTPVYTLADKAPVHLKVPNNDAFAVNQTVYQVDKEGNVIKELGVFENVAPSASSTINLENVELPAGASEFYFKTVNTNPANPDLKAEATDLVKVERQAVPTADVKVTTFIDGQDANEPVTLTPGSYTITGTISNPNGYALTSSNTTLQWVPVVDGKEGTPVDVALPDNFNIPAKSEGAAPETKVTLPKQGSVGGYYKVKVSEGYKLAEVLGGGGTVTAEASDPAYAKALTGSITTNPDEIRLKVGEEAPLPIFNNDSAEGADLNPATTQVTVNEEWEEAGENTWKHKESGVTVTLTSEGLKVVAGDKEGTYTGLSYTLESTLGDTSSETPVTIYVYNHKVGLQALVGTEQADANTSEDAYKVRIPHTEQKTVQPVTLKYTNPGTDPITITGFQQVNTSNDGSGWSYMYTEPKTLAPGETAEFMVDMEFEVGEHTIDFKVLTLEGVVATDPVVVLVEQEAAPEEPKVEEPTTPATKEETPQPPAVEQQKPTAPVVQQQKPKAPTPVFVNTGLDGMEVEAKTSQELQAQAAANTGTPWNPLAVSALAALSVLVGGLLMRRKAA